MGILSGLIDNVRKKKEKKFGVYEKIYNTMKSNEFFTNNKDNVRITIHKDSDDSYAYSISIINNPKFPHKVTLEHVKQNWLELYIDDLGYVPSSIEEFMYLYTNSIGQNQVDTINYVNELCLFAIERIVKRKIVIINVHGKDEFILGRFSDEGSNKLIKAGIIHSIEITFPDMDTEDKKVMYEFITKTNSQYLSYLN